MNEFFLSVPTRDGTIKLGGELFEFRYIEDILYLNRNGIDTPYLVGSIMIKSYMVPLENLVCAAFHELGLDVAALAQIKVGYIDGNPDNLNPMNLVPLKYPDTAHFQTHINGMLAKKVVGLPGYYLTYAAALYKEGSVDPIEWVPDAHNGLLCAQITVGDSTYRVERNRLWALTWLDYPAHVDHLTLAESSDVTKLHWHLTAVTVCPIQEVMAYDGYNGERHWGESMWNLTQRLGIAGVYHHGDIPMLNRTTPFTFSVATEQGSSVLTEKFVPLSEKEAPLAKYEVNHLPSGTLCFLDSIKEAEAYLSLDAGSLSMVDKMPITFADTYRVTRVMTYPSAVFRKPHEIIEPEDLKEFDGPMAWKARHIYTKQVIRASSLERLAMMIGNSADDVRVAAVNTGEITKGGWIVVPISFNGDWPPVIHRMSFLLGDFVEPTYFILINEDGVVCSCDEDLSRYYFMMAPRVSPEELRSQTMKFDVPSEECDGFRVVRVKRTYPLDWNWR